MYILTLMLLFYLFDVQFFVEGDVCILSVDIKWNPIKKSIYLCLYLSRVGGWFWNMLQLLEGQPLVFTLFQFANDTAKKL